MPKAPFARVPKAPFARVPKAPFARSTTPPSLPSRSPGNPSLPPSLRPNQPRPPITTYNIVQLKQQQAATDGTRPPERRETPSESTPETNFRHETAVPITTMASPHAAAQPHSRPTNNQLLYKAHFRWKHYTAPLSEDCSLPVATEPCASVTSAFLQILATIHNVEACRVTNPRNILSILSTNTRRTKVVEMSTGTHRVVCFRLLFLAVVFGCCFWLLFLAVVVVVLFVGVATRVTKRAQRAKFAGHSPRKARAPSLHCSPDRRGSPPLFAVLTVLFINPSTGGRPASALAVRRPGWPLRDQPGQEQIRVRQQLPVHRHQVQPGKVRRVFLRASWWRCW